MRAFVVACLLLAGAASVHGQGYVASVAYMKSKVLPGGVSYIAAVSATADRAETLLVCARGAAAS
jgi:hypothetical protein